MKFIVCITVFLCVVSALHAVKLYEVTGIISNDKIQVDHSKIVKLVGIKPFNATSTPGISLNIKACKFLKEQFLGKKVYLIEDGSGSNSSSRYVVTEDGCIINKKLIRKGLAITDLTSNFEQRQDFLTIQGISMSGKIGGWNTDGPGFSDVYTDEELISTTDKIPTFNAVYDAYSNASSNTDVKIFGFHKKSYNPMETENLTVITESNLSNGTEPAPGIEYTYTPKPQREIHTGPRGGKFYYNDKGKKQYIPKAKQN